MSIKYEGSRINRNSHCPCGSGRKFKNCCKDERFVTVNYENTRVRTSKVCGEGHGSEVRSDVPPEHEQSSERPEEGLRRQTERRLLSIVQLGGDDARSVV